MPGAAAQGQAWVAAMPRLSHNKAICWDVGRNNSTSSAGEIVNVSRMPIGISSFEMLREGDYYYIDKSNFVAEVAESVSAILLLPRPRRFGKTLNMTMLQAWYECSPDGSNATHLFKGLRAETTEGRHQPHKGKLPVIFLTFKDIKKASWEATRSEVAIVVAAEIRRL